MLEKGTAGLDRGDLSRLEGCIPSLRRYGLSLSRDPQEVQDLVHDCVVRALEKLHTRKSGGDLRPWLFAIMHNQFVSRFRRRRGPSEALESVAETALARAPAQEASDEVRRVWDALYTLPEEERSTLVLVSVEGLSYADVARVFGIPIGTVMSRLSRARARLAQALDRGAGVKGGER